MSLAGRARRCPARFNCLTPRSPYKGWQNVAPLRGDGPSMSRLPCCAYGSASHPAVRVGDARPACGRPRTSERAMRIRPTNILWIDADRLLLGVCGNAFERCGYRLLSAGDGAAAIDVTKRERPGFEPARLVMFGMDGLEVSQRLRAEPTLAENTYPPDRPGRRRSPRTRTRVASAFVCSKPFGPEQLLEQVSRLLAQKPHSAMRRGKGLP